MHLKKMYILFYVYKCFDHIKLELWIAINHHVGSLQEQRVLLTAQLSSS